MPTLYRWLSAMTLACVLLSSCTADRKNTYGAGETGHDAVILYGKIKSSRPVAVTGQNTGTGTALGAVGGGLVGSAIGRGTGNIASIIGGAVLGGIAGAVTEQSLKDQQGVEYIIRLSETGETRSIVQTLAKDEVPIPSGQCVMLQMNGAYQRVLPDNDPADCPATKVQHKHQIVKTKLKGHAAETTIEHDDY